MTSSFEIEITLHKAEPDYQVDLRFNRSDSEADVAPIRGNAKFEIEELTALSEDREEYGKLLHKNLFSDPKILERFVIACALAEDSEMPLRLRLYIAPDAAALHLLCWEALRDPKSGELLVTRERFLFSRFISNEDFRPVRFRARDELRALVVIANPSNLSTYTPGGRPLAPLDVAGETSRANTSLGTVPVTIISAPGEATLNGIVRKLREGYDILYLICHGALIEGEPRLYLEDEEGKGAIVPGSKLVTRMSELKQRPRLVVLASCQSAGTGAEAQTTDLGVLAGLGPQLAQAGIPAVIAMQGNVTMRTVETFMPLFFAELQKDGQVDRAMAVARGAVRDWEDWWMPVLFMSLKQGQIRWYTPGFRGENDFERWKSLVNNICNGNCTPIIGSGMLESFAGSFREIARDWATTHKYPMAGSEREQLPLVAQYLVVNQGETTYARDEFRKALKAGVLRNYGHDLSPQQQGGLVEEVISAAGAVRREQEAAEPHKVLASLNLPVYLTTNPDNLLADALFEVGKKPHVVLCPKDYDPTIPPQEEQTYRATKDEPLVYHLFGHLREPDSVVLTQDDYFDYLIEVTKTKDIIPKIVRSSLTNTALLFLGFQMSDWDFRVFFRSIKNQEGGARRKRFSHVAVQIDPEQERLTDAARARKYLESYFLDTQISIYWGSAEDFLSELQRQMKQMPCPSPD